MKRTCWIAAALLLSGSVTADAGLFGAFGRHGRGCHRHSPSCAAPAECCEEPSCGPEGCAADACAPECCAPDACCETGPGEVTHGGAVTSPAPVAGPAPGSAEVAPAPPEAAPAPPADPAGEAPAPAPPAEEAGEAEGAEAAEDGSAYFPSRVPPAPARAAAKATRGLFGF